MSEDPIVITGAARTPIGSFQGSLSAVSATDLGAVAISAAIERSGVAPDAVEEVLMGCVLPAGLRQAPARQAALGGGLPGGGNIDAGAAAPQLQRAHRTARRRRRRGADPAA